MPLQQLETELRKEMREMEMRINRRISDILARNEERDKAIMILLKPISETYDTASHLGKWVMGAAVFISIVIGIALGVWQLISKAFNH